MFLKKNSKNNFEKIELMKREIKFRAWCRNGQFDDEGERQLFVMIDSDSLSFADFKPLKDQLKDIDDEIYIMQYTGLKDNNGKEIYDGDIIAYTTCGIRCRANIIWNEYCGAWHYQYKGALGGTPCDYLEKIMHNSRFPAEPEVIGNIYENPELIK